MTRRRAKALLALYVFYGVVLTLGPAPQFIVDGPSRVIVDVIDGPQDGASADESRARAHRLARVKAGMEDFLNVVAVVPLGILLPLSVRTDLWLTVLVVAGISLLVESAQWIVGYRSPQLSDVGLNTLGGLLGTVVVAASPRFRRAQRSSASSGAWSDGLGPLR